MNINLSSSYLFANVIWGAVGTGFSIYGWRQKDMIPLFGGVAMIAGSYFISSAFYMSLASIALIAAIIWLKKHF